VKRGRELFVLLVDSLALLALAIAVVFSIDLAGAGGVLGLVAMIAVGVIVWRARHAQSQQAVVVQEALTSSRTQAPLAADVDAFLGAQRRPQAARIRRDESLTFTSLGRG
jgi:hypothetical protein